MKRQVCSFPNFGGTRHRLKPWTLTVPLPMSDNQQTFPVRCIQRIKETASRLNLE
jgi:hypothetical protein